MLWICGFVRKNICVGDVVFFVFNVDVEYVVNVVVISILCMYYFFLVVICDVVIGVVNFSIVWINGLWGKWLLCWNGCISGVELFLNGSVID